MRQEGSEVGEEKNMPERYMAGMRRSILRIVKGNAVGETGGDWKCQCPIITVVSIELESQGFERKYLVLTVIS